jgi:hypothetical protein
MHSNCGITFDLHAIRARHPAKQIVRFRARVGNLESKQERYVADAWVLVDGEQRYHRQSFSREDGPESIDVPLNDRDRFLVLAVTDVGGNTAYDWVAFGDPIIELASKDKSSADSTARAATTPGATYAQTPGDSLPAASTLEDSTDCDHEAALEAHAVFDAVAQYSTRLISWHLVTSIWTNVERTPWHDMIALAPVKL